MRHLDRAGIIGLLLLAVGAAGSTSRARADALEVRAVAAATASDDGPEDGVFDAFADYTLGSVTDNGWTSDRTAFEFSLARIPAGATLHGAAVTFVVSAWEGPRSIAVHGYPGDGAIDLQDFSRHGPVGTAALAVGTSTVTLDASALVASAIASGATHAGFAVREDPPNGSNLLVMQLEMDGPGAPLLRVEYEASASPPVAARLEPVKGSPFTFAVGSGSSQVPLLSPDERHLYVSSVGAQDIIVFDVAAEAPSLVGRYASPGTLLGGMAFSASGEKLYAIASDALDVQAVGVDGGLTLLASVASGAMPRQPLAGIAHVRLEGGEFLYVNDNQAPNHVSGWRLDDAGPAFLREFPTGGDSGFAATGLVAAPTLAVHGARVFALDPSPRLATTPASVAVFDVRPDGALVAVPGSPFDIGTVSAAIAVDPGGTLLFAGGGAGDVVKLAIAPDGSLSPLAHAAVDGATGKVNGLAVDPTGRWLAFSTAGAGRVVVLDAATLAPIEGGVVVDAFPASPTPWVAAGLTFDRSGRLFVGHTGGFPVVSVYRVVAAQPADTTPPVVTFASPAAGALSGELVVNVTVSDASPVTIACTIGGVPLGEAAGPTFSATVSTLAFLDGPLSIACRATDAAGNVGAASVDVTVRNWTESLSPATLQLSSAGRFATVVVEGPNVALLLPLAPGLALVAPGGGAAAAVPFAGSAASQDANADGIPELLLKFDRAALAASLADGVRAGTIDAAAPVALELVSVTAGRVLGSVTVRVLP